jgi:putative transposase
LIKTNFSRQCEAKIQGVRSISRRNKKEQAVWQRRFWEHQIRDEEDWRRHVEYIHYNPVRHKLMQALKDWKYSSFHRYIRDGIYNVIWGANIVSKEG